MAFEIFDPDWVLAQAELEFLKNYRGVRRQSIVDTARKKIVTSKTKVKATIPSNG